MLGRDKLAVEMGGPQGEARTEIVAEAGDGGEAAGEASKDTTLAPPLVRWRIGTRHSHLAPMKKPFRCRRMN